MCLTSLCKDTRLCILPGNILWNKIHDANAQLGKVFQQLQQEAVNNKEQYIQTVRRLAAINSSEVQKAAFERT